MCTAITFETEDFYFGRNLDLEYHYDEKVTVTPRNFVFNMRNGETIKNHFALIGMATVSDGYPLYYEATNEKGLSLAGLNFPQNAMYYPESVKLENIAPFELIPRILGRCETVSEALSDIAGINIWNVPFSEKFPLSPLHWILADRHRAVTLEPMSDGLRIYENPIGVLTNNPPFDFHMHNLGNYMNVTSKPPQNRFSDKLNISPCSVGMGAIGLPGDPSSASRFIKAAFTKLNSVCEKNEHESVAQFFHILGSVVQQRGVTCVREGDYEYTIYSSCCNAEKGIYYYTTYENSRITAIDMHKEELNSDKLITYPLILSEQILHGN